VSNSFSPSPLVPGQTAEHRQLGQRRQMRIERLQRHHPQGTLHPPPRRLPGGDGDERQKLNRGPRFM